MNDIAVRVNDFIVDNLLLGRAVDLAGTPSFLEAGIIDSTGVLELVQFLEETWSIDIADDEILPDNLDSIANLVRFIEIKTAAAPALSAAE